MELATRRVHFAGSTANLAEPWMLKVAKDVSDQLLLFAYREGLLYPDRPRYANIIRLDP